MTLAPRTTLEAPLPELQRTPAFSLKVVDTGRTVIATVHGPLDIESAPRLISQISTPGHNQKRLVLDLTTADYVDSAGVRALLLLQQQHAHVDTELRLAVQPGSRVDRVLKLLRLEGEFNLYPRLSEAFQSEEKSRC